MCLVYLNGSVTVLRVLSVYIIVYDYVVYLKDRVREREREGGERRGRDKQKRRPPTC